MPLQKTRFKAAP